MKDPAPPRIRSAVLVPVFRRADGELCVVLVRRAEGGLHGGELGFPGGKCEPADASPRDTALREAREEVGLAPGGVEILEELPAVDTLTTGYLIFPFLGRVAAPAAWHPDADEIAEVLEVPVNDLARPAARGEDVAHFPTWPAPKRISFFKVGGHRLWGASYRILQPVLPRLLAGEWRV
ncbi:MAG TPA: CoA pyrophosphatase [Opitutaceae bacterium]|nr:CoA pyrophosphatase [Opitutaceae bacterium]